MKIENYQFPKSSFLSIEKDFALIIERIMKNSRLKKLLAFDTRDALKRKDSELTQEQTLKILNEHIKIVPNIEIDTKLHTYLVINFDNFIPNDTNPEFRDNDIIFDIVCHVDNWQLDDFQLRPYKIAGELDYMFNEKRLTGIGKVQFYGAQQLQTAPGYITVTLMYRTIHGEEDKKGMLNPKDEEQFRTDFNNIYNK